MPGGKKMMALSRSPVHEVAQPSRKGLAWHFDFLGGGLRFNNPAGEEGKDHAGEEHIQPVKGGGGS
jgi:hypothetical protein